MAQLHILSVLLFWREEKISSFWVDLFERLRKDRAAIDKFNSPERQSLILGLPIGDSSKDGWVEKIWDPVGNYIKQIKILETYRKEPNTKNVFELLQSFRNLVSHKAGCSSIAKVKRQPTPKSGSTSKKDIKLRDQKAAADSAEALEPLVNKIHEHGLVKFWLKNFPEFSLITCQAGYDASLYYHQVDMKNIPVSWATQFVSLMEGFPPNTIPMGLHKYSEILSEWIQIETSTGKTAIWKHSFTVDKMKVSFLAIPENSAVDLANRELLALNWMFDEPKLIYILNISRKLISTLEETSDLFKSTKTSGNQNASSSIELKFAAKTDLNLPFITFTDVLPSALKACLNIKSEGKQCVIFTNQPIDYIKSTVQQFFKSRQEKYTDNPVSWDKLSSEYRKELSTYPFPLHVNSKIKLDINDINSYFRNYDVNQSCSSRKTPDITLYSNTNLGLTTNTGTNSGEIDNTPKDNLLDIDSMLVQLMHDKSRLLCTFIEHQENLMTRCVTQLTQTNVKTIIPEKDLLDTILQQESKSKNLYIIYGTAGMGKSTFVAEVGHLLIQKFELVLFTTGSRILSDLKEFNKNAFVEILWQHNKFQQKVARYVLDSKQYPFTIIIDGFQELSIKERKRFFNEFLVPLLKEYEDLVINIFLTGRSDNVFKEILSEIDIEKNTGCIVNYLELTEISRRTIQTYMTGALRSVNISLNDTSLSNLVKECMELIIDKFGSMACTPFACKIIVQISNDLSNTSQGSLNRDLLSGHYMYEKFHIMHLQEEAAKTIQNHQISNIFRVNSQFINIQSPIFQIFKEAVEKNHGHASFKLRFPLVILGLMESYNNELVSDTVLDLVRFSETHFPDYYCSLFMTNRKSFVTREVFTFKYVKNNDLKYYSVLKFLNTHLQGQKTRLKFERNFSVVDVNRVLFVLLHTKLYDVFVILVETLADDFEANDGRWATWLDEIDDYRNTIMTKAITTNSLKAIKLLVKLLNFNFERFPLGKLLLFNIKELNSAIDDNVLEYLLGNGVTNLRLKNDELRSLVIQCLKKKRNKTMLITLIDNGNDNQQKVIRECCESLLVSNVYRHLHNDLFEVIDKINK